MRSTVCRCPSGSNREIPRAVICGKKRTGRKGKNAVSVVKNREEIELGKLQSVEIKTNSRIHGLSEM